MLSCATARCRRRAGVREFLSGHLCRCTGYGRSCSGARRRAPIARGKPLMLDLGTSFLASVERDPDALAIVDGAVRLTYREWYGKISALVAAFDEFGLKPGDHLVTVLQNRLASRHHSLGLPVRRHHRHPASTGAPRTTRSIFASRMPKPRRSPSGCLRRGAWRRKAGRATAAHRASGAPAHPDLAFAHLVAAKAADASPRVNADAWSLMLYTSGTTVAPERRAPPPPRRTRRRRRPCGAEPLRHGERTLGVMPLYHTMGVRSLLAMSLIGGTFVCLPHFDVGRALATDRSRACQQPLSGADALPRPRASRGFRRRRRRARCASSALPAHR